MRIVNRLAAIGCLILTACVVWACAQAPGLISAGISLAQALAPLNTNVQTALNSGALVCGVVDSTTGKLVAATAVAVLNASGQPVTVENQLSSTVQGACDQLQKSPGPAPDGTTNLPTAKVSTTLPPVQVSS